MNPTLKTSLRVAALCGLAVLAQPAVAHHNATHDQNPNPPAVLGPTDVVSFAAGSLIIPMDGCYARPSFMSNSDLNQAIAPYTIASEQCNATSDKDDGLIPAYTLIFRLVLAGIPVHWSIEDGKTGWNSIDFAITKSGGGPVLHRYVGSSATEARYATINTVRYRGAPFVIAAAHAAQALTMMDALANTCNTGTCYDEVDIHVAQIDFQAPIFKTIEQMPKLGVIDATSLPSEKTGFLEASIKESMMDSLEGTLFDYIPWGDVKNGLVSADDYDIIWVPSFTTSNPISGSEQQFFNGLAALADGGAAIVLQDDAIGAAEGAGSMSGMTYTAAKQPGYAFMTTGSGIVGPGADGTWDNGDDQELTKGTDYSDPASQFGGIVWTGIGGSKYNWKPRYDYAYGPGVRRMIYTDHATDSSKDRWDLAAWRHKDNDTAKGIIYYLGGYNWRRVTASGFRVLMNTLLATQAGEEEESVEVSRSAPIIALVDDLETQYAGTFETQFPPEAAPTFASAADADDFEFPHVKGHMRALDLAALPEGETNYDDADTTPGLVLFDVNVLLPDHDVEYTGQGCAFGDGMETNQCRRIFTNVGSGATQARLPVTTGNVSTLQPMLGAGFTTDEANTLIARIHAGNKVGASWEPALGGVDRSTVAVIEPSPVVPAGSDRATVMYFGGLDGMLHAVCADTGPGCPSVGTELWAFLPASEIGKVATNSTRIDGSPKVADVFGDFPSGEKSMRTVLTFQTGNGSPSAVYALDITDPTEPEILWEHVTEGAGGSVAMGWVSVLAQIKPVVFVQSALSSGTLPGGFTVTALDTDDGDVLWTSGTVFTYASSDIPVSAVPGGVTLIPNGSGDQIESILAPGLDGRVWLLSADDGENRLGSAPIFDMQLDYRPIGSAPTLYRKLDDPSRLHALIATGGFADWNEKLLEWSPSDADQYAVGFPITEEPVTRTQVQNNSVDGIFINFGPGNRAFSSGVVAGNELFITTDSENINSTDFGSASADTGRLYRASLTEEVATSYTVIRSGAASVDFSMTTNTAVASGGGSVEKDVIANFSEVGLGTETSPDSVASRRLWLRLR